MNWEPGTAFNSFDALTSRERQDEFFGHPDFIEDAERGDMDRTVPSRSETSWICECGATYTGEGLCESPAHDQTMIDRAAAAPMGAIIEALL